MSATVGPVGNRRRWLAAVGALVGGHALAQVLPSADDVPGIRVLDEYRAGRSLRFGRLKLVVPRIADNGNAVSMRVGITDPGAIATGVRSIRLFSETNPVPLMARFDFVVPPPRVEIESRIRLAGTQRVVAVAELADGTLDADVVSIIVTLAACLDGS
jgi:sulfur-oxidizing protein SoxY